MLREKRIESMLKKQSCSQMNEANSEIRPNNEFNNTVNDFSTVTTLKCADFFQNLKMKESGAIHVLMLYKELNLNKFHVVLNCLCPYVL